MNINEFIEAIGGGAGFDPSQQRAMEHGLPDAEDKDNTREARQFVHDLLDRYGVDSQSPFRLYAGAEDPDKDGAVLGAYFDTNYGSTVFYLDHGDHTCMSPAGTYQNPVGLAFDRTIWETMTQAERETVVDTMLDCSMFVEEGMRSFGLDAIADMVAERRGAREQADGSNRPLDFTPF